MATKTKKPAASKPAASEKPAATTPATEQGVGIKELSAIVGKNPKSVRAAIRRLKGGAQVGQGGRYKWDSTEDPAFVELVSQLSGNKEGDNE